MRGDIYKRLKVLIDHDIGLYAAHLPLDIHKEVGNNVQMAHLLGLEIIGEFFTYKNITLGVLCQSRTTITALTTAIKETLGDYTLLKFGKEQVIQVGIVTGSGKMAIDSAIESGCDTFITGEIGHMVFHTAKENNLNIICAGHYKTETLGIKALQAKIKGKFAVETVFIDVPTGL